MKSKDGFVNGALEQRNREWSMRGYNEKILSRYFGGAGVLSFQSLVTMEELKNISKKNGWKQKAPTLYSIPGNFF